MSIMAPRLPENHGRIDELMDNPEATPLERAMLHLISKHEMVMQSVADELVENTKATKAIASTLTDHIGKEEMFQTEIKSSMRTGRWITSISVSIFTIFGASLVGMLIWIWNAHITDANMRIEETRRLRDIVVSVVERVSALESRVKMLGGER